MAKWNQCSVCGQFIGLDDFMGNPPKAVNKLVQPDSLAGPEQWDTYHLACDTRQVTSQQKPSVGRETKHRHPITGD